MVGRSAEQSRINRIVADAKGAARLRDLGVQHAIFSAPNAPEVVDLLGEIASQVH